VLFARTGGGTLLSIMLTGRVALGTALWSVVSLLAVTCLPPSLGAAAPFDQKDFQAAGSFELVVKDSKPLTSGTRRSRYQNAFVSRVHGLVPGNADGIEIVFVTKPITPAALSDILTNDAKELRGGEYAALVLFLDKHDNVSQVNMSYVVPGTTVARTVAWKPDDLKKHFSRVTLRGRRVTLKSKGTYSEIESGHEALTLTWDVDVDLPVVRELTR
jgi:hypothetical protein